MILDMKMMEGSYDVLSCNGGGESTKRNLQIIEYSPYDYDESCMKLSSSSSFSLLWFDIRVFYVRVSGIQVNESTSQFLYLHHIPLSLDTLLEINGVRTTMNNDGDSSILRRDRIDKKSEQVTFVNTDSLRLNGSIKFEICDKDHQCILSCVLEMNNGDDGKRFWSMNCETEMKPNSGFFKGKHGSVPELTFPEIEVYVAGCFLGKPIILTRMLQFNCRKKQNRKLGMLDVIPEYETTECKKDVSAHDHHGLDLQGAEYRSFKPEQEEDYNNMYWQRTGYMDMDDGGELSWFNAGVRVGVGIGLGICVGVGIGVSLLARSYQTTSRKFKRRFI